MVRELVAALEPYADPVAFDVITYAEGFSVNFSLT